MLETMLLLLLLTFPADHHDDWCGCCKMLHWMAWVSCLSSILIALCFLTAALLAGKLSVETRENMLTNVLLNFLFSEPLLLSLVYLWRGAEQEDTMSIHRMSAKKTSARSAEERDVEMQSLTSE